MLLLPVSRVLCALIDVATDEGRLTCVLCAMRLSQCIVQARTPLDSPLCQLPGVDTAAATRITHEVGGSGDGWDENELIVLAGMRPKEMVELLRGVLPSQRAAEQAAAVVCGLPQVLVRWAVESIEDLKGEHAAGGDSVAAVTVALPSEAECVLRVDLSTQGRAESKVHTPPQVSFILFSTYDDVVYCAYVSRSLESHTTSFMNTLSFNVVFLFLSIHSGHARRHMRGGSSSRTPLATRSSR